MIFSILNNSSKELEEKDDFLNPQQLKQGVGRKRIYIDLYYVIIQ